MNDEKDPLAALFSNPSTEPAGPTPSSAQDDGAQEVTGTPEQLELDLEIQGISRIWDTAPDVSSIFPGTPRHLAEKELPVKKELFSEQADILRNSINSLVASVFTTGEDGVGLVAKGWRITVELPLEDGSVFPMSFDNLTTEEHDAVREKLRLGYHEEYLKELASLEPQTRASGLPCLMSKRGNVVRDRLRKEYASSHLDDASYMASHQGCAITILKTSDTVFTPGTTSPSKNPPETKEETK